MCKLLKSELHHLLRHSLSLSTVPECDIEYDVFISYSCKDEDWVKEELLKSLEAISYSVYIDFKDFVPGMYRRKLDY